MVDNFQQFLTNRQQFGKRYWKKQDRGVPGLGGYWFALLNPEEAQDSEMSGLMMNWSGVSWKTALEFSVRKVIVVLYFTWWTEYLTMSINPCRQNFGGFFPWEISNWLDCTRAAGVGVGAQRKDICILEYKNS